MKKALMISGMILLVLMVAAGSFWGGMAYESNRADRVRDNFMQARGQGNGGPFPQDGQIPVGEIPPGFLGSGGTNGQVKTIDGNVMTVSTAQDVTTVHLSAETQIGKSITATIADIQPGLRVRVTGERDEAGDITAEQVTILADEFVDDTPSDTVGPSPTGTEP